MTSAAGSGRPRRSTSRGSRRSRPRTRPGFRVREALRAPGGPGVAGGISADLEAELRVVARAPALRAPAGRLFRPRPHDRGRGALAVLLRALGRLQMMELHRRLPRSFARGGGFAARRSRRRRPPRRGRGGWTFAIMPRISGRSSFRTRVVDPVQPRRRTVSFWAFGRWIPLRTCVTRIFPAADSFF